MIEKEIETGSDFSGVGAFNQALDRLKIKHRKRFACDLDKYARQTYVLNYGEPEYFPRDVYERKIPKNPLDIYMTSPPCQTFSNAGNRDGENDERGVLFYNSHEFIKINQPRFFIFENVKGLLSDDKGNKKDDIGRTFRKWLDYLGGKSVNGNPVLFPHPESVSYHIYWKVLNAKDFGIPQNRERVFIVGIRDDVDNDFNWPKPIPLKKKLRDILEPEVPKKCFLSEKAVAYLLRAKETRDRMKVNIADGSGNSTAITANYSRGVHNQGETYIQFRVGTKKGFEIGRPFDAVSFAHSGSETKRSRVGKGVCQTLDTSITQGVIDENLKIRRLTPRECFRLMDFPDSFQWPVSDTQAYKQAGNSIVVAVLSAIISKLKL